MNFLLHVINLRKIVFFIHRGFPIITVFLHKFFLILPLFNIYHYINTMKYFAIPYKLLNFF